MENLDTKIQDKSEAGLAAQAKKHLMQGNLEEAAEVVNEIILTNPSSPQGMFYMGLFSQIREKPEDALLCFSKSAEYDNTFIPAHIGRAQAFLQLGNIEEAKKVLLEVASHDVAKIESEHAISLARSLHEYVDVESAVMYLERYSEHHGDDIDLIDALADLTLCAGKIFESMRWRSKLRVTYPSAVEFSNHHHVDFSYANKEWALKVLHFNTLEKLDLALTRDPLWEFGIGQATVSAIRTGDYTSAIEHCSQLFETKKNSPLSDYLLAHLLFLLANAAKRPELRTPAMQCALRSAKEPWAESMLLLAKTLLSEGSLEAEGLKWTANVLSIDPSNKEAHQILGYHCLNNGRVLEGLKHFHNCIAFDDIKSSAHPLSKHKVRFLDDGNTYSMGALAINLETFLKMRALGWMEDVNASLLAIPGRISNPCLLDYWSEHIQVIRDPKVIDELYPTARNLSYDGSFARMPDGRVMFCVMAMTLIQREWDARQLPPLLKIEDSHRKRALDVLEKLGMPRNSWFVAIHVREGGFKQEGNQVFNAYRNAEIDSYIPAIEAITEQGGWVIRMGEPSMKQLPKMKNVIDYAHSEFKSDWMDIFLCGAARFYLGASGGIFLTPNIFGTPIVGTNWPTAVFGYSSNAIILPKMMYETSSKRPLSFKEMMSAPIIHAESGNFFKDKGYSFRDNTSEEILEATIEMLDRLNGTVKYSIEDEARMSQYRSLLSPDYGVLNSRCGKEFLLRYSELL